MSEDQRLTADEVVAKYDALAPELPLPSPTVGQQLRIAREAKKLTILDVARVLKLSSRQVEQIECDAWNKLPCAAIVRGFVRNYARFLDLPSEPLMLALDDVQKMHPPLELKKIDGAKITISDQEKRINTRDLVRMLSGLAILLLAIVIFYIMPPNWWSEKVAQFKSLPYINYVSQLLSSKDDQEKESKDAKEATAIEGKDAVSDMPIVPVARSAADLPPANTLALNPSAELATASAKAASAEGNVLKFSFSQSSWVEVRDGHGELLMSQENAPGVDKEIVGKPPFTVVIGNAKYVSLHYKGKNIDLSKRSKDDVVRVTLE